MSTMKSCNSKDGKGRDSNGGLSEPGAVGARNDDSSLFSLESLSRVEHASPVATATREDSGLIDLNALGAIEQKATDRTGTPMGVAPVLAPPDLFPMFGPSWQRAPSSPLIAVSDVPPDFRPTRSRSAIWIGASTPVAIAVAFLLAMRSGAPTPAPVVAAASTALAPAATLPAIVPEPRPNVPSPLPSSNAVTPGQVAPKAEPPKPATALKVGSAARSSSKPSPAPQAKPAPKPVADVCDLGCQMQRAVNGH
jgi:hypothetical protein